MKYLRHYITRYMRETILAPLFKMLEALFDLFVPIVVARMIDQGIGQNDTGMIIRCCLLLVALALIGLTCSFVAQYFAARSATGCSAQMRHDLFQHIQRLSGSELDTIGTSTLITRITGDINQVQNGLNLTLRLLLRSPFIVFGAMIMAFTINARISLIFLAAIVLLSAIVFGVMRSTNPRYKQIQAALDRITQATRENLNGVRVIRAFGREAAEVDHFHQANDALVARQTSTGRISALMNPLTCIVVNLGIVAILYIGARSVNGGLFLSGSVVALVNYMSQILVELVKLANLIVTISRALASLSRVEAVLDTKPGMTFEGNSTGDPASREAVRFDHVSLIYAQAGEESLTDISFTAMKGETIGVIGGTGSGKSSLVSLIHRGYDATEGTVSLMGTPITAWDKKALHRTVNVVMQKAQLFKGTIRSNLLWGNENASEEDLRRALETAQAAEFVFSRPDGLDEAVEQGGRNLSGGQKQRLTIARALVGKPDVLILDDSASALDFATDAALRAALRAMPGEQTTFIVSQRTSSLRHADRILVLDDGRLVGQGTHDELLANCDLYREIHESQFRKEDA